MAVFNSGNNIAGYFQTYKGGKAAISVFRKSKGGSGDSVGSGFMVSQYNVAFQRAVALQRFLNLKDSVAIVGAGNGTIQLTGLVGKLEDFNELLGDSGDMSKDICDPLYVRITDSSSFAACEGTGADSANSSGDIICGNCIVTGVNLGGQIDQNGVIMQTGSLTLTFNELEIKP